MGALALFGGVHEARAASAHTHVHFRDADHLTPIFRDGFSSSGFHDFYRGMANASNWFSIDSMEMLLGLASALVALLALLFLCTAPTAGPDAFRPCAWAFVATSLLSDALYVCAMRTFCSAGLRRAFDVPMNIEYTLHRCARGP